MNDDRSPVGGIPFFLSLIAIYFLGISNITVLPGMITRTDPKIWLGPAFGSIFGGWIGWKIHRTHLSVLYHELKHAIVSVLVGNRFKGISVSRSSGYFKYEYTKHTAQYNALISLAPYSLPIISLITFPATLYFLERDQASTLLGLSYGLDLILSLRDVSPCQSDLTDIRGGFVVGLIYVIGAQILFFTLVITLLCFGLDGLYELGNAALNRVFEIVS